MRKLGSLVVGLMFLVLSSASWAEDFAGKVVGITDGDSIEVLSGTTPAKIRLNGIDCPESHQGFGQKAKAFTSEAAFGKIVSVKDFGQDKYSIEKAKELNRQLNRQIGKCP